MSQSIAQVDDETYDEVINFTKETSRYNEEAVQRVSRFLSERYAGQGPETMGAPITLGEVLPLISGS